MNALRWAVKF